MSSTAQNYYSEARNELVLRIRLREQVLNYFLVAAGVILGIAISEIDGVGSTVALVVPLLGLGTSIIITNHTMVITSIARYTTSLEPAINACREENLKQILLDNLTKTATITGESANISPEDIKEKLKEFIKKTKLLPWDRSGAFKQKGLWASWQRLLGNIVVILGPAVFAIYIGGVHLEALELQRDQFSNKYTTQEVVKKIKASGNSDEALTSILEKQRQGKESIAQIETSIKVHKTLFYGDMIIMFFILIVLSYGLWDRKQWIHQILGDKKATSKNLQPDTAKSNS